MSRTASATSSVWSPLRSLARVEGTRLIRHPAFLAGVGFVVIGAASFIRQIVREPDPTWSEDGWTTSIAVGMLAILTMVATNLAALRDRRSDTDEQHSILPVGPSTKTGALLAATAAPAAVAALLLLAVVGVVAGHVPALTATEQVHLAERLVLVVMLGALGVALAVWLPTPFVAPVVGWGLILVSPGDPPQAWQVLTPFATPSVAGHAWLHLAYLAGLAVLFGVVALARSSRSRWLAAVALLGTATVVVSAVTLLSRACPSTTGICRF